MRVACIADLHGQIPTDVAPCDVLLIAGDLGPDDPRDAGAWLNDELAPWLRRQPAREIVAVAGNHDHLAVDSPASLRSLPWRFLEHETANVAGLRVAGSAWSPTFGVWPLQADDHELDALWRTIPDDAQIVLVHGPPFGHCDLTERGVHGGSRTLLRRLLELPELRLVCTGHIHEGYGTTTLTTGALVVNASLVDARLELVNEPIVVELQI